MVQKRVETSGISVNGQVQRALKRFALAAAAGEMATHFGLTGWKRREALDSIVLVAKDWLHNREVDSRSDVEAALDQSRTYLSANLAHFNPRGLIAERDGWQNSSWILADSRWEKCSLCERGGTKAICESQQSLRADQILHQIVSC